MRWNYVILIGYFKIKEWKGMQMNGMQVALFESNIEGKEQNHFMKILLLDPYFKING